jgi:hypothetical protein
VYFASGAGAATARLKATSVPVRISNGRMSGPPWRRGIRMGSFFGHRVYHDRAR